MQRIPSIHALALCAVLSLSACSSTPFGEAQELALEPGQPAKGNVLVVLSSARSIELTDGSKHPTGYFLGELIHPVEALLAAGYEVTFATPTGQAPRLDRDSLHTMYWLCASDERDAALRRVEASTKLERPRVLGDVDPDQFIGLFVPGGHAPMVDLATDPHLAGLLRTFHLQGKPTGLLCHGPAALLSAVPRSENEPAWPYAGYEMAIFTSTEESFSETFFLGGAVPYRIDEELSRAGADLTSCPFGLSRAVRDRELITGQNPYSADAFADEYVAALEEYRRRGTLGPRAAK